MLGSFGLQYQGLALELWLGNHAAFHQGPKVNAADSLFAEFQACIKLGIDPDDYFKKDKFSRMLIVGGSIADSAIASMRQHDMREEQMREAERERNKRR